MPFDTSRSLLGLIALALMVVVGCSKPERPNVTPEEMPAFDVGRINFKVNHFCGDCHVVPLPVHFAKDQWLYQVTDAYRYYFLSRRNDLTVPPMHEIVEFYRRQAPAKFDVPTFSPPDHPPPTVFEQDVAAIGGTPSATPGVSYIQWLKLRPDLPYQWVFSDMRNGGIRLADGQSVSTIAESIKHPAHVEPCDLDGDGLLDLIVADLGSFLPQDHQLGRACWLRGTAEGFEDPVTLLDDVGRVADVRQADFDADGDNDLIVAEFGWRLTGSITLLRNRGVRDGQLKFSRQVVDERHGAIHVPPTDLDGDGRMDFVTLLSQEHEAVEAHLNTGNGFERKIIYETRNPAYGSTGIELIDLDQDGDLDVLYTNGDVLDSTVMRPYHGIQWLENRGSYPFTHHHITAMPGVHRALAEDFDGDGDLDIAAVAMLPEEVLSEYDPELFDSVIWLEQTTAGTFSRHVIENASCNHAALQVGDFDEDGDVDLAVGNFHLGDDEPLLPWISIWWNRRTELNADPTDSAKPAEAEASSP